MNSNNTQGVAECINNIRKEIEGIEVMLGAEIDETIDDKISQIGVMLMLLFEFGAGQDEETEAEIEKLSKHFHNLRKEIQLRVNPYQVDYENDDY